MKILFATIAALFAIVGVAQADSAFSDAFSQADIVGGLAGSGDTLDTGFSFGAWGDPTTSDVGVQLDLDAQNISFADAIEPANFGSDQAFADTGSFSNVDALALGQSDSDEQGTGGSFAAGSFDFFAGFTVLGDAFADANDD